MTTLDEVEAMELLTPEEIEEEEKRELDMEARIKHLQQVEALSEERRIKTENKRRQLNERWKRLEERRALRVEYYHAKILHNQVTTDSDNKDTKRS